MYQHEVDYKLHGDDMQYVEILLDAGETVIAEAGSLMMLDEQITLSTRMGDGSSKDNGLLDKMLSAGKRMLAGERLFMTMFTNDGRDKQRVYFASPYPGKIIPMDLRNYRGKIICQRSAFLAAAKGIRINVELQKKLGAGLFGGEGFILQSLEGYGMTFIHAGGAIMERHLEHGESIRIDTGCFVAMTQDVTYDIERVGGVKTMLFGGEGVFFAHLTGPGTVWIQSLPINKLASRIYAASPSKSS